MLRKVLGTVLLLGSLVGCSGPASTSTCKVDADCGEGTGICDKERGLCYAAESEVDPERCDPRCAPYEACAASLSCVARYTALTVTPGTGSVLDGGVVPVTAELVLGAKFNPSFPESLDFSVVRSDGGTVEALTQLSRNEGVYTAQWTPPGEGVFLLTAAYPESGGPSTTVQLTVDTTPPTFAVAVPPADTGVATDGGATYGDPGLANAWRRDQVVPVEIRTNEPNLDPSSLTVALKGTDGGLAPAVGVTSLTGACDAGFCGVAQLKLWEPALDDFRGALPIVVQGRDRVGNVGSTSATSVNVTRWKWVFDASSGGTFAIKAPPAIGAQGTVYLGVSSISTTGKVFALQPDGRMQWSVNTGGVISGPTVGALNSDVEKVYVGVNPSGTAASLLAFNGNTGAEVGRCDVNNGQIASSLALTQISSGGAPIETAVGLVNVYLGVVSGTVGALFALRPEGVASPCNSTEPVDRGQVTSSGVGPLVIDGDNVFFANTTGQLTSYRLGTATARAGWPVSTSFPINSLALVGSDVVGANGGGSFSDQGRLFSVPKADGASTSWSYPSAADLFVNQLSVGQANTLFFGAENLPAPTSSPGLAAVTLGGSELNVLRSGSSFKAAPAIGRGGALYAAASDSGLVGAWSTSNFTKLWTLTTGVGATSISPALDCARDATGTARAEELGILYVAEGGKLYSFVVDSRGLDPLAPWPKFQHDARNTGNPATPVSSCP